TIDDLLFHGASLWARRNGADGLVIDAWRIPADEWKIDADGRILVNDEPVAPNEVIFFPGPAEGLLTNARDTIRGARAIDRAWIARTRSPIPPTLFVQKEEGTATDEE